MRNGSFNTMTKHISMEVIITNISALKYHSTILTWNTFPPLGGGGQEADVP